MIGKRLHTWGWSETELDERLAFLVICFWSLEERILLLNWSYLSLGIYKTPSFLFRNQNHHFQPLKLSGLGQQFQCTHFGIYTNINLAAIMRLDLSCFLDLKPFYVWDFGGPVTILLDLRF